MKYRVIRAHQGDKDYREGAVRELSETGAAHLVKLGVLELIKDESVAEEQATTASEVEDKSEVEEKAEIAPENKAEPAVENKAAKATRTKAAK
ncbi:hypothetical protein [Thioclava kandeliae]|uniref:Uncharacterized protein n=1 Tax=Thioclava kandeliae TaxID=3070818 RepID=A0ABV1SFA7_9RHOB